MIEWWKNRDMEKTMPKFKAGDRVKTSKKYHEKHPLAPQRFGTVFPFRGKRGVVVAFDVANIPRLFPTSMFELA